MVKVNKVLGLEDVQKKPEKITPEKKEIPIEKQVTTFISLLRQSVDVLELAIYRKIPYSQISLDDNFGLKMEFNSEEFKRKIQKFGLKGTVKNFSKCIDEFKLSELYNQITQNPNVYFPLGIRVLYFEDLQFIGIDTKQNTIYFSIDKNIFLLFDLLENFPSNLEQKKPEITRKITEKRESNKEPVIDKKEELLEEKEVVDNITDSLDGVDDLINRLLK